jgi:hypothetical protein
MVFASGETVRVLRPAQQLATDAAGDVFFTAELSKLGRAIVRRAHAAALPSTVVLRTDACPLGGTFDEIDDELDVSNAGEIVFDAECGGGHGAFRKSLGWSPVTFASLASTTAIGSGVNIGSASIDGAGTRIAGSGFRVTLQRITCAKAGCDPPVAGLAPGAPIANAPGQFLTDIDTSSLAGSEKTLGFFAATAGVAHRQAILRLEKGRLDAVASEGDLLPGGVGTFDEFVTDAGFIQGTGTIGVGDGVVAFHALVEHPTASTGVFAATADGLTAVALDGDPAPRGDAFEDFSAPVVRGRSIVFPAMTSGGAECIFATRAPGRPIAAVACIDDPVPAPVGGTIADFLALPAGTDSDILVPVAVSGGASSECLLRYRKGTPSLVRCEGDVYPGGLFYGSFQDTNVGPLTDAKGKSAALVIRDDQVGAVRLLALRRDAIFPLVEADLTPAPTSGGQITSNLVFAPSLAGRSVVLVGGIHAGTASTALFRFLLP